MKDSEFIDLLNLYLDHEISAADAARLEAEVQSNPTRRRVYQDYCRMQKACKLLAQDFGTEPTTDVEDKIVAFEQASAQRGARRTTMYVVSGLAAAAACVAVVFVGRSHNSAQSIVPSSPVAVQTAPAAPMATTEPAQMVATTTPPAANRGIERRNPNALSLRNAQNDALTLSVAAQNDPHFAWIQDLRLTPIQNPTPIEQLRFDTRPNIPADARTFTHGNAAVDSQIAIRFQK